MTIDFLARLGPPRRSVRALVAVVGLLGCSDHDTTPGSSADIGDSATAGGDTTPPLTDASPACNRTPEKAQCAEGWCRIEPGCFTMGAPRDEFGNAAYADVQVNVTLTRSFLIQQTEVTQEAWLAAGFPNPSGATPSVADCSDPKCPVGNVRWVEAAAFANYLSRVAVPPLPECYSLGGCSGSVGSGMQCESVALTADSIYACEGYRLPTEAEWEYAARAGTTTAFYAGPITRYPDRTACNADEVLDSIGWYCFNSGKSTHPVGLKKPNGWGLVDMSGNAAEWVNDYFDGLGYGMSPLVDPGGSARDPFSRVLRGGAAATPAIFCKSAYREQLGSKTTGPGVGFRLARTVR